MISIIKYGDEEGKKLVSDILSRSQLENKEVQRTVDAIIADIRQNGDKALFEYTKKFDKFDVTSENILVKRDEIEEAYSLVDKELTGVIKRSAERITSFHEKQKVNSWLEPARNGEMLGQLIRPLERVGVYVPGGKAAYPSSVLMNIVPAKVAGVGEIIMTTPPDKNGKINPTTIVAADIAGVDKIYKAGGAQAVAALAFGTERPRKYFCRSCKKERLRLCKHRFRCGPQRDTCACRRERKPRVCGCRYAFTGGA